MYHKHSSACVALVLWSHPFNKDKNPPLTIRAVMYISVMYLGVRVFDRGAFFVLEFGITCIWHCALSVDSHLEFLKFYFLGLQLTKYCIYMVCFSIWHAVLKIPLTNHKAADYFVMVPLIILLYNLQSSKCNRNVPKYYIYVPASCFSLSCVMTNSFELSSLHRTSAEVSGFGFVIGTPLLLGLVFSFAAEEK